MRMCAQGQYKATYAASKHSHLITQHIICKIPTCHHSIRTPSSQTLVNIPKIQVLLIRQIPKRSRIQIPPLQPPFHRTLNFISTLVLPC
jgi:hypothetical protein